MYLFVELPTLPYGVKLLDSVGTLMFEYVELYIGTELVERLYGETIEMKYDLEVPVGKQGALTLLDGKTLQFANDAQPYYTLPLPFSTLEKGIPLCAFKEDVTFRVVWNPTVLFTTPPTLLPGRVRARLNIEYTYISQKEIDFIKASERIQIFEQIQRNTFFAPRGAQRVQCNLEFYNPVKELLFVFQNDSAQGYDYSNTATGASTTIGTTHLLNTLELTFNSIERVSKDVGTPQFLNVIQALEFHTRIPDRLFYIYSFSLDPEGGSPVGSVNFSRIKNQNINIQFNESPTNIRIRVYALSYNWVQTSNNSSLVLFSNFK